MHSIKTIIHNIYMYIYIYIYRHTHTYIDTHAVHKNYIFEYIYIYIYRDTHTQLEAFYSPNLAIFSHNIYISATPFILFLSFFVCYGTFAHMGVLPFLFHLSYSLRHIKFSFILLFKVSCGRATQSITHKLEISKTSYP